MTGRGVAALVGGWVDLYTRGMPTDVRAARRDEIDDDLWCQQQEAAALGRSPRSLWPEMLLRLLLGVPADVSWRLANRRTRGGPAPERSTSVRIRVIGALALLAGASWGVAIILVLAFGESVWEESSNASATVMGAAGSLGLAAAAVGLIWRFQDQVGPLGSLGGMLVAIGTILGTLGGYTAFLVVPIGSAMLAWDLGRAGILSRPLSIAHVLSSAAFSVTVIRVLIDYADAYRSGVLIAFTVPYVVTWIAIGASLIRGVPRAHEPATGG
jgi:hypothetical protein